MGLRKLKETTTTKLVIDYLRRVDDMRTARQIADSTGCTVPRVHSALWALHTYNCVELVDSPGQDRLYWFALPIDYDQRTRSVDERTPETKPRRKKMKKDLKKS